METDPKISFSLQPLFNDQGIVQCPMPFFGTLYKLVWLMDSHISLPGLWLHFSSSFYLELWEMAEHHQADWQRYI